MSNEDFLKKLFLIKPNLKPLEKYNGIDTKISFECLVCGDVFTSTPYVQLRNNNGCGCKKCEGVKQKTHEEYLLELKELNKNIVPIEKYKNRHTKILHKCLICNYTWSVKPSNLLSSSGCPCCSHKVVVKGINDLWTTDPDIAKLLVNLQDGYEVTRTSHKKLDWRCPHCHNIAKGKFVHSVVKNQKISCKHCSDGVSYPMKFTVSVFSQLKIPIDTEVRFEWCKYKMNNQNKTGFYDIVFNYNNNKYIIELDGAFHFKDNNMSGQRLEDSKFIDEEKDRLAFENGYKIIRIKSIQSTPEYMTNAITTSELSDILNFDEVDFDKANKDALSSLVYDSAILWGKYHSSRTISEILGIRQEVVVRYLNKARKSGLCDYDGHLEQIKSGMRNGKYDRKG